MTVIDMAQKWDGVQAALVDAKAVAWDGCHKIYVLMDDGAAQTQIDYGYRENNVEGGSRMFFLTELDKPLETLTEWWEDSCGLRFITAISTDTTSDDHYTDLISQFDDEDEDDDREDESEDGE